MIKQLAPFVTALTLLAPVVGYAAVTPNGTGYDQRIKTVRYNPDDVYRVRVRLGTATLIQLEEGETLETPESGLGIGDANGWTIAVRGNNIFMKPKMRSPDTNINLVTNKRTYAFSLESVESDSNAAYILRFDYPEPEPSVWEQQNQEQRLACTDVPMPAGDHINYDYWGWGDSEIAPSFIWDDGRFTCMKYPRNSETPAIYRVGADGEEMMVNSHTQDDTIVVHTTANEFRLRLGGSTMGITTGDVINAPYNNKHTSVPGTIRETVNDE